VDDDGKNGAGLRPRRLDDYIGQDRVRENLQVSIAAAAKRGEALDHVLLYGPPGLGKTTLAHVIANELGVPIRTTAGPVIEKPGGLGGILSNVANKFLLDGFFRCEPTWRNISAIRSGTDFKTVTSYRLIGKDQYEQVQPGGEIKQGTLGQEVYTNKADTYGLVLSIDRRDIINDDLNAITTVPRKLGRGSGLKINDVFWTTFMTNAAFFGVGNKNYGAWGHPRPVGGWATPADREGRVHLGRGS